MRCRGIVNVSFPGCSADALLLLLDAADIDCSTGSACSAGVALPSHVLLAMGSGEAEARSSLRFSLGNTSTASVTSTPSRRRCRRCLQGPPGRSRCLRKLESLSRGRCRSRVSRRWERIH